MVEPRRVGNIHSPWEVSLDELKTNAKRTSAGDALNAGNPTLFQGSRVGSEDEILGAVDKALETLNWKIFLNE